MYLFDNPWKELDRMQRQMDSLSGRFGARRSRFPAVNLYDGDDTVTAEFIVPGLTKETVDVTFENGILTVKGERKVTREEKATVVREERNHGTFSRSVEIPVAIEHDKIAAELTNGILTIALPKAEEAKPKQIMIS